MLLDMGLNSGWVDAVVHKPPVGRGAQHEVRLFCLFRLLASWGTYFETEASFPKDAPAILNGTRDVRERTRHTTAAADIKYVCHDLRHHIGTSHPRARNTASTINQIQNITNQASTVLLGLDSTYHAKHINIQNETTDAVPHRRERTLSVAFPMRMSSWDMTEV